MPQQSRLSIEEGRTQLLWLTNPCKPLFCEKLLRHLPGKRWVCLAQWDDQIVVAKLFLKAKHAQRELNGNQALSNANICTPALLHHGWTKDSLLYVLVYEFIPHDQELDITWRFADLNAREELLHKLINVIAKMHQAGISQTDIHLRNFIAHANKIYVLDTGSIKQTHTQIALSERQSLKNLAALFAQLAPENDLFIHPLFLQYTKLRDVVFTLKKLAYLRKWIAYWRRYRLIKFGQKIFRNCSQFIVHRRWNQFSVCDKNYMTAAMRELLANPDEFMQSAEAHILKAGNSSTVVKIDMAGRYLVIKRYNLKSFWHGVKRALQPTRAAICWRNSQWLSLLDIPTVKPVACLEKRCGFWRRQSYFIAEYVQAETLQSFFVNPCTIDKYQIIAENIASLFRNLATVSLAHGDMKATNILLLAYQPILIDLDAMKLYRCHWLWKKAFLKDKNRFLANWTDNPSYLQMFEHII